MRIAIIAVTMALVAGPAAAEKRVDKFVSGNWSGSAYYTDANRFSSCSIYARYRSGISLYFALTHDGRFHIGFWNPEWVLKTGSRHRVALHIDRERVFSGIAEVITAQRTGMVLIDLPLSKQLFDRFRGGYVLHVDAPRGRMGFSLAGSNAALIKMVRCATAHLEKRDRTMTSNNPFGTPSSRQPGRDDAVRLPNLSDRVRAVTLIANVLSRVAIGGYEILPVDEMPRRWRRFHALWRTGKTIGLVRLYRNASQTIQRAVYAAAVAKDLEECKGSYQSGVKRGGGPGRATTFFSRCIGAKDWSIYYLVVGPDKSGITYLVGLYSPDKNEPLELGERLRRAVTAIVLEKPAEKKVRETFEQ